MRPLAPVLLLSAALAPGLARPQEEVVRLKVGETRPGFGTVRPACDAPAVAVIEAGVLRAVGPGETVCSTASVQAQGTRRVYRVIVTASGPEADGAGAGGSR